MNDKKNLPSHRIFAVRNYEKNGEEKASWTEIGVMFPNKDKLGFSIQLQATPIDGRCVARIYEERPYESDLKAGGSKPADSNGSEPNDSDSNGGEPKAAASSGAAQKKRDGKSAA